MPRAPPVTTATRPLRSSWFIAGPSWTRAVSLSSHGCLALLPEAGDAQTHGLTWLQVKRWLLTEADSGRRAGRDHVAGLQAHELADVADQMSYPEDHRSRAAVLIALAVHLEPHVQVLRVGHFVGRHKPRTQRPKGVVTFALPTARRARSERCAP